MTEFMDVSKSIDNSMQLYKFYIIQYFHDKAVAKEIDHLSISCPHEKCNWTGEYLNFQVGKVHAYVCTCM